MHIFDYVTLSHFITYNAGVTMLVHKHKVLVSSKLTFTIHMCCWMKVTLSLYGI